MAIEASRQAQMIDGCGQSRVIGRGGVAYWLSAALAVAGHRGHRHRRDPARLALAAIRGIVTGTRDQRP